MIDNWFKKQYIKKNTFIGQHYHFIEGFLLPSLIILKYLINSPANCILAEDYNYLKKINFAIFIMLIFPLGLAHH